MTTVCTERVPIPARSLATAYVRAATAPDAPPPAPYPIQGSLTAPMRMQARQTDDLERMPAWAGQSAGLAKAIGATELVGHLWSGTQALLG